MNGKIVKQISNQYTVNIDNQLFMCQARGKFRNDKLTPLVGDEVIVDMTTKVIMELLPRTNELHRPSIANVDAAIIVTSAIEPELSLNLLDKFISIIEYNSIEPIILLTKLDLISSEEVRKIDTTMLYYKSIGYKVLKNTETNELLDYLKGKTVVLTGQTGAGKSSLLNKLDSNLKIETNVISQALGRGKHTTRHTELYDIKGVLFADTPGFGSLDLSEMPKEYIKNSFIEFSKYNCRFRDCNHVNETKCMVKDAVNRGEILKSRYDNYISFIGGKI